MLATERSALASGGMTHCFLRWGLSVFFLASARSCCRWHARRCTVHPPPLPTASTSIVRARLAVWSRQPRPAWPRLLRRRCASPTLANACGSGRPRSLPPPALLAGPGHHADADIQSRGDLAVAHPSPASETSAFNRMLYQSLARCLPPDQRVEPFASSSLSFTTYFYGNMFLAKSRPVPSLRSYRSGDPPQNQ